MITLTIEDVPPETVVQLKRIQEQSTMPDGSDPSFEDVAVDVLARGASQTVQQLELANREETNEEPPEAENDAAD